MRETRQRSLKSFDDGTEVVGDVIELAIAILGFSSEIASLAELLVVCRWWGFVRAADGPEVEEPEVVTGL